MTRSLSILFLCEAHSTVTLGMITVRPFFKNRPRSCVCPFRGEPLTERLTPPRRLIANRTPNNMAIDLAKQKENRSISKRKGLLNLRLYNRLLLLRPPTRATSEIPVHCRLVLSKSTILRSLAKNIHPVAVCRLILY